MWYNTSMKERTYIAIDLKSFYASVECIERGLNPLTTNLVVADTSRTDKTICLAVSPSLKAYGIPGRARLFEVNQILNKINIQRRKERKIEISFITATPRMAHYIEYSTKIYNIYLKYVSSEDIHVYSIDEVFIDITSYLKNYHCSAKELASKIIIDVLNTTGITATCGIGSNLYLCKVAMDIVAKHIPADENGVRIAELDVQKYKELLWDHRPLTDFWRVGKGYTKKLEENHLYTMGDIARCSIENEALLYKLFGVNAELLIDHAWGIEPCTIQDIKSYKPENTSLGSGQVLHSPYSFEKARIVVQEMSEQLSLDLFSKNLVTNQIVLTIGYDIENVKNYTGSITTDYFGRQMPKHAHSTTNLKQYTASTKEITQAILKLYDQIVNKKLTIRRINLTATHLLNKIDAKEKITVEQFDLFTPYEPIHEEKNKIEKVKEENLQRTILNIKQKYGKNAVLKVQNLEEGATAIDRNKQIGGHKA